jgi:MerR family transcriptional regulator, gold-responsive activator of gol and ges genes
MAASRNTGVTIGEAAGRSSVSAEMIRYYEQTGLLRAASRKSNGYRKYSDADIQLLILVHHARSLHSTAARLASIDQDDGGAPR